MIGKLISSQGLIGNFIRYRWYGLYFIPGITLSAVATYSSPGLLTPVPTVNKLINVSGNRILLLLITLSTVSAAFIIYMRERYPYNRKSKKYRNIVPDNLRYAELLSTFSNATLQNIA